MHQRAEGEKRRWSARAGGQTGMIFETSFSSKAAQRPCALVRREADVDDAFCACYSQLGPWCVGAVAGESLWHRTLARRAIHWPLAEVLTGF